MRILLISPRRCWPADTGAKLREFHLARSLSEWAEVSLLAFSPDADDQSLRAGVPFAHRVTTVPAPPKYTVGKVARGLFGPAPVTVLNCASRPMREALGRLLTEEKYDLVQLEGTQMASYQAACKRAGSRPLLVYDWHNIESDLLEQYGAAAPSAAYGIYARLTAARIRAMEQRLLATADAHLVCSCREREALLARVPGAEVFVAPNGVDPEQFPEASPTANARVRSRLVFVGSMDYHANISAAVEFTNHVWPALRPHLPGCQLTLVGCNPAPEVRALARQDGVIVTGTVPDVRPYYEEALAAVVPLRTGSGTRLKILEAMAARVPVVSSTLGAEGLDVSPGENVLIADSVTEWVSAIQRLASDKDLWRRLGTAGRALVEERYDWRTIGRSLRERYMDLQSRRSAR